jgi:Flp pilus assembly protein TadG
MTERPTMFTRFLRSERGSFTVEAVVIFPLLVWAYTAMFVFWDAFKTQNINLKATYTIADMISREQEQICTDYIEGARSIYAFLNAGDSNHQVRVTNVRQIPDPDGERTTSSGPGRPRASLPTRARHSSRASFR